MIMPVKLKENERSWAIQIIQEISAYVKDKPDFIVKRAGGEKTINTGSNVMFPDVLLYGDTGLSLILQGWELKMPDVPINDSTFVNDSWRKADNLGLTSTVIWNFRFAIFYVKNATTGKFEIAKKWDNSSSISENRQDVELYKDLWLKTLHEVIDEVNRYFVLGTFKPIHTSDAFINNTFESFINNNKKATSDFLKEKAKADSVFANYVDLWWDGASAEYINDEKNPLDAFAKVILLDWINKITFAHIIRSRFATAEKVTEINNGTSTEKALDIFEEITNKCDYYPIFHKVEYEQFLPDIVWSQLVEINQFLTNNRIDNVEQQNVQDFLESAVKTSQRVIIGQYTTNPVLADFLVRIATKNANGICFDPCCGTGTFAKAFLNYKLEKRISETDSYKTVFSSDRQSFPLQIARLAMISKDSVNLPAIVFQKNVFDIKTSDSISIVNPQNGDILKIKIPKFDTIVSNLPFIDFCKHNTHDLSDSKSKSAISEAFFKHTNIKLSQRSDYYMYIIFHLWNLLKENGTLCVLTSNSWMATTAGSIFLTALSHYFKIKGIIKSGYGRWFKNAGVVTTAFLLEKKQIAFPNAEDKVAFYLLNTPLAGLKEKPVLNKAVGTILQNKEIDSSVMTRQEYSWKELSTIQQANLSFNAAFFDCKWITSTKDKLIEINKIFSVFRGAKTGQDDIFMPKSASMVDSEYVSPMLKNSKGCDELIAKSDNIFVTTDKSYKELEELGHKKTADYFRQFEGNLNKSVLQHGNPWYNLKEAKKKAVIITGMNPDKRLFFARFENPTCINQRLIGFYPHSKDVDIELCHALLNSIFGMFYIEATGFGRGLGALDLSKEKVVSSFMLNPDFVSAEQRKDILKAFEPLLKRKILTVQEELKQEDRKIFDKIVLKSYGLESLYERIKKCLLEMMSVRLGAR